MPQIRVTLNITDKQKDWFDYQKDVLQVSYASLIRSKLPRDGIELNSRERVELLQARRKGARK